MTKPRKRSPRPHTTNNFIFQFPNGSGLVALFAMLRGWWFP